MMCCAVFQCQAKGHTLRAGHRAETRQTNDVTVSGFFCFCLNTFILILYIHAFLFILLILGGNANFEPAPN